MAGNGWKMFGFKISHTFGQEGREAVRHFVFLAIDSNKKS